ncbi:hypothetical protein DPMN_111765 [Dreissena polymorpha]|uniref:Uncharacterized protein n=1 Tax=Dreissena polymorpha TaxID=45954 RepID=A0A9D4KEG1_DREPO|nr:hypothetical protein DPMN_111765 [Dreissena polymorpha]
MIVFNRYRNAQAKFWRCDRAFTGSVVARFYTMVALSPFVKSEVNTTLLPNGSSGIKHQPPDSEPNLPMEAKLGIAMSLSMQAGLEPECCVK